MWAKHKHNAGFTIVELLIVIVVIAILAAISIVAYNGIQQRARASAVSSALNQAAKKIAIAQVDTTGAIPTCAEFKSIITGATLNLADTCVSFTSNDINYQYKTTPTNTIPATGYCITATKSSTSRYITNTGTLTDNSCPGHSNGGSEAITNLALNPTANGGTTAINSGGTGVVSIGTEWASTGTNSFKITPNSATNNDSYMTLGGDLGGFRAGLQAGKTYTISATVRLAAPLTGSLAGNGSRQITAWYTSATGSHSRSTSNQAPNVAGQARVSVTYSIPSDATAAWLRFYNGAVSGSGIVWYDDIMITEGSTQYAYADGDSPGWDWNGSANNATSTGSPL